MSLDFEAFKDLTVEAVDRLRMRIKVTDTDLPPTFKAHIEKIISQVVGELDSVTLTTNPVFLLDKKTHDSLFQIEWNYVGRLMDEIANECLLRHITNMPLSVDEDGIPDVQISISVDISRGYRTFTYFLNAAGDFDRRSVVNLPTLTLDTNVVRDKWEIRPGVEAVNRLLELSMEMPLSVESD